MAALSKHYSQFFRELASNNNREWFHENKARFEEYVKEPFEALTADVIAQMKKLDPKLNLEVKDAVFRIYKDIRFSADKTPYKTYMAAIVSRGGRKDHSYPGLYYQVGVDGVAVAGGVWEPDKDRLMKIRAAIAKDPKGFRKLVDHKKFKDTFGGLKSDRNKIIPKEFRAAGEIVPEIYNKSFHYWTEYKAQKDVQRPDLAMFLVDHYRIAGDYNAFLAETLYGKGK